MPNNPRPDANAERSFHRIMDRFPRIESSLKKRRRRLRVRAFLAVTSVVAYPTILAFTDHILPTGNIVGDGVKYGLELFLATATAGALGALSKERKAVKGIRRKRSNNGEALEQWHDMWGA